MNLVICLALALGLSAADDRDGVRLQVVPADQNVPSGGTVRFSLLIQNTGIAPILVPASFTNMNGPAVFTTVEFFSPEGKSVPIHEMKAETLPEGHPSVAEIKAKGIKLIPNASYGFLSLASVPEVPGKYRMRVTLHSWDPKRTSPQEVGANVLTGIHTASDVWVIVTPLNRTGG